MRYTGILLLFFAVQVQAQINTARMDTLIKRIEQNDLGAGALCIMQGGNVVHELPYGRAQTAETEYRIGSVTKMFTAVLIYQLIDEGRLSLTDKLGHFFSDLPNAGKITIARLLGHSSGLANFTNTGDFDTWKDQPQTQAQLLDRIRRQPADFAPGAKKDYNNSNYLLLGYIVEKIYNKPYKDILEEKVLQPLKLRYTRYGDQPGFTGRETPSFKYVNGQWQQDRAVYLPNFDGAGAIISTPADMCTFITALFAGRLISQASLDTMCRITGGYGKGLFPYGDSAHPGYGHNGKTEGFGSSLQYYPDKKLAIAYCTNAEVYPRQQILDHLFKACFNEPDTLPAFDSIAVPAPLLRTYTGTYKGEGTEIFSRENGGTLSLSFKARDFTLIPISQNTFWNKPFGFFFEFKEDGKMLIVRDVDAVYEFRKQ